MTFHILIRVLFSVSLLHLPTHSPFPAGRPYYFLVLATFPEQEAKVLESNALPVLLKDYTCQRDYIEQEGKWKHHKTSRGDSEEEIPSGPGRGEGCGFYRKKGPMPGCLIAPWEAQGLRRWLQSGSTKPMGQTPLNIQPHKIIVNHTWFQYTRQEILPAGGHQYSFPRGVVHEITHTAITTLLGFPRIQSKKMRPHEVRAGILLSLGPLCPTGDNISCNNSIGIAAKVPSRDLASFKSLWSVKHKAMASSQVSSSSSLDTIYCEGSFLPKFLYLVITQLMQCFCQVFKGNRKLTESKILKQKGRVL